MACFQKKRTWMWSVFIGSVPKTEMPFVVWVAFYSFRNFFLVSLRIFA